jgi:pseudaminic acid cytidylyltransferase
MRISYIHLQQNTLVNIGKEEWMNNMNIAIIPARGGSKRIPMKNIKIFHGKPMLAYSIEAALNTEFFDRVLVSTDNSEIQRVARHYGATCDYLRPDALSDDFVGTTDVVKYEVQNLTDQGFDLDVVAEIYPTAPLMRPEFVKKGLALLASSPENSYVFSAVEFEYPVQRGFQIIEDTCVALDTDSFHMRSQDLTPTYHDAAQFYIAGCQTWLSQAFRFDERSIPLLLPREYVVDIDNESDWKIAEAIAAYHRG